MNHLRSYALGIAAALVSLPMYASMPAQPQNLNLVSANAELTQGLNSKSTQQGQSVTAKLTSGVKTDGQMELPKGTILVGKVDQAQNSNSDGNKSSISIVFNEARLRNGREVPIKATLLAAYPPVITGVTQSTSSYMIQQPRHIPNDTKVQQDPGTLGNVTLKSAVQSNVSGVFLSKDHNINLHQGTRFQLAIAPETSSMSTANGS
ncbi:MAG TPA: hypothetical protein VE195_08060 [Acidobacteriaceae bacterium]|nr:hypothetical protein [Acidobacteriaceae bacterium]